MRREFIVRVTGTLLVVSYLPYGVYTSMQISIIYHCIEICMCKYTKTMKMKNVYCMSFKSRVYIYRR